MYKVIAHRRKRGRDVASKFMRVDKECRMNKGNVALSNR